MFKFTLPNIVCVVIIFGIFSFFSSFNIFSSSIGKCPIPYPCMIKPLKSLKLDISEGFRFGCTVRIPIFKFYLNNFNLSFLSSLL